MATTPNYSFSVYSSTDTDVRFLDFRVATAGSQSTSNFYVIDTVLKQHSDAIDSINATPSAFVVKGTYSAGSLYTASVANYPGYKNEQLIVLSLNQKNTGAVQININGTTNKDVMKYGSNGVLKAVDAGDFVANSPVLCLYDGTRFVVIGITSASSITVTGEAGDILQIADDGTIESSGKKAAQPNGIATLDENGNVVQVANMANSAAAVYDGEPVSVEYVGQNRIASITAYGENAQGGTTEAPVALTGVDSVHVCGRNLLPLPYSQVSETRNGLNIAVNADGTITVSGTATAETYLNLKPIPASLYNRLMGLTGIVIAQDYPVTKNGFTFFDLTIQPYGEIARVFIIIREGSVVNRTYRPYIIKSAEPLPYETYQGSVTPLPIPRPLRRVGDVKDKCVTRVKSECDKRVVANGTESWTLSQGAFRLSLSDAIGPGYAYPCYSSHYSAARTNSANVSNWPDKSLQIGEAGGAVFIKDSSYTTVEEFKAHLVDNPLTVYYQSTAYDGTNGLDVCMTEYQTGFVELDGETLAFTADGKNTYWNLPRGSSPGIASGPHIINSHFPSNVFESNVAYSFIFSTKTKMKPYFDTVEALNAYLAAQKAAGTPVQVVYQLATPEVYATEPVDFDNTAGPLTVVTGGQVEVKMTDFVTDRTPAFLNKLDKTGDGSDVTVTFTEAATDTDIASGDKLSILFGKILKRFSTITSKFTTVDNSITQIESDISDITDGTTVVAQANKVTNALVIMSNSGTALVNYDGSATANMTLSPSNVGAEPAFTKNTAFNKNFGSSAGTVCQGNDSRLSNARRSSNISMSLSGTNLSISYS